MKASDVMTRDVLTVGHSASISEAIGLMLESRVSGLPVLDDQNKVVGILTEGDLLHRSETATERHRPRWLEILMGPGRIAEEYIKTHGRKVEEIMTREVVSVTEDTPLDEIVQLMERHRIKRVPVLEGDVLRGMVSRADLLRALARTLDERPGGKHSDDEIREQILAELEKVAWVPRDGLSISVSDGVVDLNGVILEEKEREALRVVAENTPGVTAVEDHLVWIEPVSGLVIEPSPNESSPGGTAPGGSVGRPMRALLLGLASALSLAAGSPAVDAATFGANPATTSWSLPAASHKCGKGQHWVPAGYAKHGKYRTGHCAPN